MKISIVTATFNSGATLADTLRSVISQNYNDFEHIVVDGGSDDNTIEIIKKFEPLYKGKLKWISEPDNGIYDAMNKGIGMATGDIIGILNSDDFFSSDNILSTISNEMESFDGIYGDVHYVDPTDLSKCVRYYSSEGFAPWKMKMGFMPAHPSFYCKREVYEKFGAYDISFKIAADFEFLLRTIFVNRIKTKYIPIDFVTMRTGGASTRGLESHKKIFIDHLKAYRKNGVKSNRFLESIRYAYRLGEMVANKFNNLASL